MSNWNKPLIGILVGAIMGFLDGLTAWFTPEVRPMLNEILFYSSIKGMLVGIVAGFYARKVFSTNKGVILGLITGLLLAAGVAAAPQPSGEHYWLEIVIPGAIAGAIIGYATQRMGRSSELARS